MLDAASELAIPNWLSSKWPGIAALARRHYAGAIAYSPNEKVEDRPPLFEMVSRLATDPQMKFVWRQLFKRKPNGEYIFPGNNKHVRAHPHWEAVDGLSQQPDERDRLQEQACMLLFSVAVCCFGPGALRVRTIAEVTAEADAYQRFANRLREDADECVRLGLGQFWKPLCGMANLAHEQAERRRPQVKLPAGDGSEVRNPWIAERKGKTSNDPWLRGFAVDTVTTCLILFDRTFLGTVAIIASVAFNRKVTQSIVKGMTKNIPALKEGRLAR